MIVGLVLCGGVLAGAEMAIVTARRGRLEQAAAKGSIQARAALLLRADPERFLATVQIGITLVSGDRVPVVGERFEIGPTLSLEVLESSPRRVRVVRLGVRTKAPTTGVR